jgi:hypothetical protein
VSWIFSFLLLGYALVRIVLRVRGQIRWLAIRDTLPVPPPMIEAPEHLPRALAELFVDSRALRGELIRARRTLTAVATTDPDAPLGRVRDARYRRAVMESWTRLNNWLRGAENLAEVHAGALEDRQIGPQTIAALRDSLRDKWDDATRARALDPFALSDLLAVQAIFIELEAELEAIERGLAELGEHPYRNRGRERASSAPGEAADQLAG